MQKITNLDKWRLLPAGDAMKFPVARSVRLEVMTPIGTNWTIATDGQNPVYLTTTSEKDVLQITVPAGSKLVPDATIRYMSRSEQQIDVERNEDENPSFAEVMEPNARDPQVERMVQTQIQSHLRRQRMLDGERHARMEQQMAQLQQQIERGEVDGETGEVYDEDQPNTDGGGRVQAPQAPNPTPRPKVDEPTVSVDTTGTDEAKK